MHPRTLWIAVAGLAIGCATRPPPTSTQTVETETAAGPMQIAERYLQGVQAINRGDVAAGLASWSDDVDVFLAEARLEPLATSRAEMISEVERRRAALDMQIGAERIIVPSEDRWIVQGVQTGTHRGEIDGMEPTGESFGSRYLQIGEMVDGRTSRVLLFLNDYEILSQLGLEEGDYPVAGMPSRTEVVMGPADPRNEQVVAQAMRAVEEEDWATLEQLVTPDIAHRRHDLGLTSTGPAELVALLQQAPFSDIEIGRHQMASAGDWVVSWGPMSARLTGDIAGVQGEGQEVQSYNARVFRLEDGQIAEVHIYDDPMNVTEQLLVGAADASLP